VPGLMCADPEILKAMKARLRRQLLEMADRADPAPPKPPPASSAAWQHPDREAAALMPGAPVFVFWGENDGS